MSSKIEINCIEIWCSKALSFKE